MDFVKQYIIQSIVTASNNLRLTTQKIEVVALLRNAIANSPDLERDIKRMKKVTVLSTFAIRLNEIYNYLNNSHLDLLRLSDKLKEHSQLLIKDLSTMLDMVDPVTFVSSIEKISGPGTTAERVPEVGKRDTSAENSKATFDEKYETAKHHVSRTETDIEKEKIIFEDDRGEDDLFFQNYEMEILRPIKPIDKLLKKLSNGEQGNPDELNSYSKLMMTNGELSAKIGFEIISNMHQVIAKAMQLIKVRELMPGKDVIESMRACLIVIVAVVRGKEVDITAYLNRAEEFGKEIQSIKLKGLS